jgi:hypothetical protein
MALHLWPQATAFGGPVQLIAADPTTNGFRYRAILGAGHMLQLEEPVACYHALLACLAEMGLSPAAD